MNNRFNALMQMLETEPNDVFLNYALSQEFMSLNDFEKANLQLQKTLQINNSYLACYYQLGQVNEKLNNNDSAINYYKKGITLAQQQGNKKALSELNEALWLLSDDEF